MSRRWAAIVLAVALAIIGRVAFPEHPASAQVSVANNAAEISGKTVMLADGATAHTVTNLFTFNRSGSTPFSVAAGSATVPNLLNWSTLRITTTGTQNNFVPGLVGSTILRCENTATLTITGFGSGIDGQMVLVVASGTADVRLTHQDVLSLAANRFRNTAASGATVIRPGTGSTAAGWALYAYETATATPEWTLIGHEQGGWVDYAPTTTPTGWASFTNSNYKYYLHGRDLVVAFEFQGASNSTIAQFTLPYTTDTTTAIMPVNIQDSSATATAATGFIRNQASTTTLEAFATAGGSGFTSTATTKIVRGEWHGVIQ